MELRREFCGQKVPIGGHELLTETVLNRAGQNDQGRHGRLTFSDPGGCAYNGKMRRCVAELNRIVCNVAGLDASAAARDAGTQS